MCGVVGFSGIVNEENENYFKKLLLYSKIRGVHATGIGFFENGVFKEKIIKGGSDQLINEGIELKSQIVGHCRYSTSDIEYNQPISGEDYSIVHNGIITQKSFEEWSENYPLATDFKTKNDSEILLKYIEQGFENILLLKGASIATILISKEGSIWFYRNEKRPLWYHIKEDRSIFIASTRDCFVRAGLTNKPINCINGMLYCFEGGQLFTIHFEDEKEDLQIKTNVESTYKSINNGL